MRRKPQAKAIARNKDSEKATAQYFAFNTALLLATIFVAFTIVVLSGVQAAHSREAVFPQCTHPSVEKRIAKVFNKAEEKQWQRGFSLNTLRGMHEHRTEKMENSDIVRRYCNATAHFSNGLKKQVYYLIESNGGFVGRTWGVTYCVGGLDPWRNHDSYCRSVR